MTETYYSYDFPGIQNMCRVCLATDRLRPMYEQEINWYQSIVTQMLNLSPENKLYICYICGHLLKKYMGFYHHCQEALIILNQIIDQGSKIDLNHCKHSLHNYVQTEPKTYNLCSQKDLYEDTKEKFILESNINVDDDGISDRDDDMPLVMLRCGDDDEYKDKKKKKKSYSKNVRNSQVSEIKEENESELPEKAKREKKRKKPVREGFSSRMVQETDEYVVIKLTEEQVLEEMRSREQSEQYRRALYKCASCVQGFNFEDVLRAHMDKHTQENGSFLCSMCSQYCPSAVSLRGHIKSHTTRYKCKVCGVVRRGRQHLLEHHALAHTAHSQRYSCHHCDFTTDKRTVIQRHVRSHRAAERHACHQCGRLFRTLESLRVHTTRHDKSRSVRCADCGRGFLYPSLLAKHQQSVHRNTDYYCVECDVSFKSPDNLRLHFKKAKRHRDSSSYTFSCPQCSERFVSAASLSVHSSTAHGVAKRHACALCRRLYSSRDSLRAHARRTHKGHAATHADTHTHT